MNRVSENSAKWVKWAVLGIFVAAFLARVALNVLYQGINSPPDAGAAFDHIYYNHLAQSIVKGEGYLMEGNIDTHWPPGTPFLLAAIYYFFGVNYATARIIFCLLGAATCIVVYFIGARLGGRRLGLLAAALLAVYPMHLYYNMHLLSEVPEIFFKSLAVLSVILLLEKERVVYAVLFGAFIGFSAHLRPTNFLYMIVFIQLVLIYEFPIQKRRLVKLCVIPLCVFIISILPWTIRNYKVTGHLIFMTTHGGITFLEGNNDEIFEDPQKMGGRVPDIMKRKEMVEFRKIKDSYYEERWAYRLALDSIARHLKDLPKLELMKVYRLVTPFYGTSNKIFNIAGGLGWALIMPFCLAGIALTVRNKLYVALHSAVLLVLLMTLIGYGDYRFRESISPSLIIYACTALLHLLTRLKRQAA